MLTGLDRDHYLVMVAAFPSMMLQHLQVSFSIFLDLFQSFSIFLVVSGFIDEFAMICPCPLHVFCGYTETILIPDSRLVTAHGFCCCLIISTAQSICCFLVISRRLSLDLFQLGTGSTITDLVIAKPMHSSNLEGHAYPPLRQARLGTDGRTFSRMTLYRARVPVHESFSCERL